MAGAVMVPSFAQTIISSNNSSLVGQNISSIGLNVSSGPGQSTDIPISGQIRFEPDNYNNVTNVTLLTIYAIDPFGNANYTNPAADGTFTILVPYDGMYNISVFPSKLDYLNKSTDNTYSVIYPSTSTPLVLYVANNTGVSGVVIPVQTVQTGYMGMASPLPSPSPSPAPTPGFTAVAALIIIGALSICLKKNFK